MSKKFQFRDNSLKLTINNIDFNVDIFNLDKAKEVVALGERLIELGKGATTAEKTIESQAALVAALDIILGEGATAKIFADRPINVLDLIDIFTYVNEETLAHKQNKLAAVYSAARVNGVQSTN